MDENFEVVPDVVNIYIWLNEHDKFKGKPKFKNYVIFVLTLTLLLQYFCAIYILYLVDFLEGVWGVFMGITTDKDKSEAMICKEMQVTFWMMILLVCQIFFISIDEKIIMYIHKSR